MKLITYALIIQFFISCWPKTNIFSPYNSVWQKGLWRLKHVHRQIPKLMISCENDTPPPIIPTILTDLEESYRAPMWIAVVQWLAPWTPTRTIRVRLLPHGDNRGRHSANHNLLPDMQKKVS